MKFKTVIFFSFGFLFSCAQTIDLRSAHFFTPTTSDHQWGGSVSGSAAQTTKITLVNDITTNPPTRTQININKDYSVADILFLNNISADIDLSILPSLEVFFKSNLGLKWQFWNYGQKKDAFVASLIGSYGTSTHENSSNQDKAKTKVTSSGYGLSAGYVFEKALPYISAFHEDHRATTEVTNSFGHFGDYIDDGRHEYLTLGVSTVGPGLKAAVEYNMIQINWNDVKGYQNTVGVLLGYAW